MSDETTAVFDIPCPGCGVKPVLVKGPFSSKMPTLEAFIGRACINCGRVMLPGDVELALHAEMGKLLSDRENQAKNR